MAISRQTVREALATQIGTDITELAAVYNYLPGKLSGMTPICTVESAGWQPSLSMDDAETRVDLVVGFFVKRGDETSPDTWAAAAEDMLDTLALKLATLLRKYYNARMTGPSQTMYEIIDGVDYRIEFHTIQIDY